MFTSVPLPLWRGSKISDFKHFRLGLKQKPVTVKEANKAETCQITACVHMTHDTDMMQIIMMTDKQTHITVGRHLGSLFILSGDEWRTTLMWWHHTLYVIYAHLLNLTKFAVCDLIHFSTPARILERIYRQSALKNYISQSSSDRTASVFRAQLPAAVSCRIFWSPQSHLAAAVIFIIVIFIMRWFDGSIPAAIATAKRRKCVFVVVITGTWLSSPSSSHIHCVLQHYSMTVGEGIRLMCQICAYNHTICPYQLCHYNILP